MRVVLGLLLLIVAPGSAGSQTLSEVDREKCCHYLDVQDAIIRESYVVVGREREPFTAAEAIERHEKETAWRLERYRQVRAGLFPGIDWIILEAHAIGNNWRKGCRQ